VEAAPVATSTGRTRGEAVAKEAIKDSGDSAATSDADPSTPANQPNDAAVLESLTPAIERAKTFAERWPTPYRSEIFRVALAKLLGRAGGQGSGGVAGGGGFMAHAPGGQGALGRGYMPETLPTAGSGLSVAPGTFRTLGGPLGPIEKLARAIRLDPDAIERAVRITNDGEIVILGRPAGKTRKDFQTRYSLVYLYVKELGLGNRLVDIEELRALCIEHGCYDQANFTGNYKRDIAAGLIREDGGKGARSRRYMLSQKGIAEGATLLRTMVEQ
jgi:hypothetical protein